MELFVFFISFWAAVVPAAFYAFILGRLDRYEKEPFGLLAIAFVWGALPAIVLALIAELILGVPLAFFGEAAAEIISASTVAPVVEEFIKALALFGLYVAFRREFDDPLDGIIYGALVGAGFAMTENALYFFMAWVKGGWATWTIVFFLRTIVFGLNHAFFTSLTGLGLGLARLTRSAAARTVLVLGGLAAAMLFHGIHNLGAALTGLTCFTLLISALSDWGGILIVFIVILLTWRQEQGWLKSELSEEVDGGLISAAEYTLMCSSRTRMQVRAAALRERNWTRVRQLTRLTGLLTELAFKKHQTRVRGDDNAREIANLRERIAAARAGL